MKEYKGLTVNSDYKSNDENIGKKVGKLTILKVVGYFQKGIRSRETAYECQCDCGNTHVVRRGNILKTKPTTVSCGCHKSSITKERHLKNKPNNKGVDPEKFYYAWYKRKAFGRNVSFELSKERFLELIKGNCYYCDSGLENSSYSNDKNEKFQYKRNGIDRIDNSLGYIENNVVSCCRRCNYAKRNSELKDYLKWSESLYLNLKQKGLIQE